MRVYDFLAQGGSFRGARVDFSSGPWFFTHTEGSTNCSKSVMFDGSLHATRSLNP